MSHSITVLEIRNRPHADGILVALAERLGVAQIAPDNAGRAQIWLQFDPATAEAAILAALEQTGCDWQQHVTIVKPDP